jgi:hypothetical protein
MRLAISPTMAAANKAKVPGKIGYITWRPAPMAATNHPHHCEHATASVTG